MFKASKENDLTLKKPLQERNCQTPEAQSEKHAKQDRLLSAVQKELASSDGCDLVSIILGDPLLRQLNLSLEKEAEQQKRSKLLGSFPLRYQNLIHTELLYKKSQSQLKEYQKQSREVVAMLQKEKEVLEDQLIFFKTGLQKRDEELASIKQSHAQILREQELKFRKEQQEDQMNGLQKANDFQRQLVRVRCERKNMEQFLEELKEECETLKGENQRLVNIITQKDITLNELTSNLAELSSTYQTTKESFMAQLVKTQLQSQQRSEEETTKRRELQSLVQGLKARVRDLEEEVMELLKEKEEIEVENFNQLQEMRSQLLETVRIKNNLEDDVDRLGQQVLSKQSEMLKQKMSLEKKLQEKQFKIREVKQLSEIEVAQLKISNKKTETALNESIELLKQQAEEKEQRLARYQEQVEVLTFEKEQAEKKLIDFKEQQGKINADWQKQSERQRKTEGKQIEIKKMVKQMKEHFEQFRLIVQEKDTKIQQHRQNIVSLRSQVKQQTIVHSDNELQMSALKDSLSRCTSEKQEMMRKEEQYRLRESVLNVQVQSYYRLLSIEKSDQSSQCEMKEEPDLSAEEEAKVKLQKTNLKYQNVVEELQAYKEDYQREIQSKQQMIEQLQGHIACLRDKMSNHMYDSSEIEEVLDAKIKELTAFYEAKLEESNRKHRTVITTLRSEMQELTQEIDLKKSIEVQIYQDIINHTENQSP